MGYRWTEGSLVVFVILSRLTHLRTQARVSLARAAYSQSNIVLLDDSLSAVDAYVGKALLENCILKGPLANRTRILVTHTLHVLDKTDYIYVMEDGVITEEGTYDVSRILTFRNKDIPNIVRVLQKLIKDSDVFARLMEEHGNKEEGPDHAGDKDGAVDDGKAKVEPDAALMQIEERMTGAVSWATYGQYLKYAGGIVWAPIIITLLTLSQCAQGNAFFFNSSDLRD